MCLLEFIFSCSSGARVTIYGSWKVLVGLIRNTAVLMFMLMKKDMSRCMSVPHWCVF